MMKEWLEYILVKSFLFIVKLLPNKTTKKICINLSLLFYKIDKKRRNLTLKNLAYIYPNNSHEKNISIAKEAYKSIGITISEILLLMTHKIDIDDLIGNKEEFQNNLKILKDKDCGIFLMSAHFGNWELAGHAFAKYGFQGAVVGREGNNSLIEKNLTKPFREMYGNKLIPKNRGASGILKAIKEKKFIGILIDQKASGTNSVKSTFFKKEADTINTLAILKLKYDCLVAPGFAIRKPDGKYDIKIYDSIEYKGEDLDNDREKIIKMTQLYNDTIENVVNQYPEQWFWMHNRWRIQ